ncbi:MAG: extracellular solute-binding protein [Candidatus Paceibacterota bacterium]|jgi:ABC-type glycerol-3-phosphate transport system substrate-binding protein
MTRFQLILTGVLVMAALIAAVLFSVQKSSNSNSAVQVTMWGTIDNETFTNFLSKAALANRDTMNISYVAKSPDTFEADLVAALARGKGPDMILLPQNLIVSQQDKFYTIPFTSYSERAFKDSFIEEGELYLVPDGIIGLPFSIDPIVMYWNRNIFSNANVPMPPSSWTDFYSLAPKIIQKDASGNISQALIAFGATSNVTHAKDMISLLSLQAGTAIVSRDQYASLRSVFSDQGNGLVPGEQAVNFFTEFSNPVKPAYSWNRSLPSDRAMFLSGRLAVYFGFASELADIRAANPNLNFDVAPVPQIPGRKVTFGNMQAVTLLKSSPNLLAAYTAAVTLTGDSLQTEWVGASGYPPVRRSLIAVPQGNAYKSVFYDSALISHAWLDPSESGTSAAFTKLIESVTSGRSRTSNAVRDASTEIDNLLRTNI